jgi:hypothetical protein
LIWNLKKDFIMPKLDEALFVMGYVFIKPDTRNDISPGTEILKGELGVIVP